jgi:hypothetical protein
LKNDFRGGMGEYGYLAHLLEPKGGGNVILFSGWGISTFIMGKVYPQ